MKKEYDWDNNTTTMSCHCGYRYTERGSRYPDVIEGDESFIEMSEMLHSEDDASWHTNIISHKIYACPKCGTLQIEV